MLRATIAGCGNIAQLHAWALSQIRDVNLISVADTSYEKAKALSDKYADSHAKAYENLTDMLLAEDIDVLHICTPHYLHVPMAIQVLKAGANVFIEKPAAVSIEELKLLRETERSSGKKAGVCFQNRYNASTNALDELAASGTLGKVKGSRAFVTWRRDEDYYSDEWHGILAKEGGGVLINQSIHTLDLQLRYLGTPLNIAASMSNHHLQGVIEVEDTLEAWMTFEGGRRACFYASNAYAADAPVILELEFEKGRASLIDNILTISEKGREPRHLNFQTQTKMGKAYWGTGHLACIRDFYSHISNESPYQNDIAGVSNITETVLKIYDAAKSSIN